LLVTNSTYISQDDPRILLRLLFEAPHTYARNLLLADLLQRTSGFPPDERLEILSSSATAFLPSFATNAIGPLALKQYAMQHQAPQQRDVIVITVKLPELYAVQHAFGLDPSIPPDESYHGIRFWHTDLHSTSLKRSLRVAITMSGEDSNTPMAAFLGSVFAFYKRPSLAVLVGMAAGVEGEVQLGDVVLATQITDYLRAKMTVDGPRWRPRHVPPLEFTGRQISYFDPHRDGLFQRRWLELLTALPDYYRMMIPVDFDHDRTPVMKKGVVLSGDRLVEDGSFSDWHDRHDDLVRAGEMEGFGFAYACQERRLPWFIVRGIADYGLPLRAKDWQFISSAAAAVIARQFIEEYRIPR